MQIASVKYKYLWILIFSYVFILISSDLHESKLVILLGMRTGAGILLFSLTYFFIGIITEVYGYKHGRLAIWIGILFCALIVILAQIIVLFSYTPTNSAMGMLTIVKLTQRVFLSTLLTVLIGEHINAYLVAKLKVLFRGKYLGIRFFLSILTASGISTLIFTIIAFGAQLPNSDLFILFLVSWFYRFATEILLVPISVKIANLLKKLEHTDIYDLKTNYNIFKVDVEYSQDNNSYHS